MERTKYRIRVNLPLQPGTDKTCAVIPRGKTYVSMDYELNKSGKNGLSVRVCDNMGTTGQLPFGVRVDVTPAAVEATEIMMRSGFLLANWKEWISPPEKLKLALMQQSRGQRRLLAFGLPPKGRNRDPDPRHPK